MRDHEAKASADVAMRRSERAEQGQTARTEAERDAPRRDIVVPDDERIDEDRRERAQRDTDEEALELAVADPDVARPGRRRRGRTSWSGPRPVRETTSESPASLRNPPGLTATSKVGPCAGSSPTKHRVASSAGWMRRPPDGLGSRPGSVAPTSSVMAGVVRQPDASEAPSTMAMVGVAGDTRIQRALDAPPARARNPPRPPT